MTKLDIAAAVKAGQAKQLAKTELTAELVKEAIRRSVYAQAHGDIRRFFTPEDRASAASPQALKPRHAKTELTAELVKEAIRRSVYAQAHGDMRRFFTPSGRLRRIVDLTADEAAQLAGFEVIIKNAAAGDGHTDTIHKIRLRGDAAHFEGHHIWGRCHGAGCKCTAFVFMEAAG